jgi:hypothetical protein
MEKILNVNVIQFIIWPSFKANTIQYERKRDMATQEKVDKQVEK